MADEKKNGVPEPSDKTLTTNYVSLKPGNYKPRTDLTKYKGKNLTDKEALDYLPDHPFGVGDASSVVYIYPQGTVEIIGKVYVWNKLVKPGIYSRYEKIRYLSEEEIQPRLDKNVYRHHAAYNRTIRVNNPYVSKRTSEKEWLLEYHYVDWNTQFTTIEGDKVYPIPILNGLLTVYPDGTFKTENVVVESKTTKLVDPYGYLGDQTHFSNIKTFYNNVTKDDINPLNVYKVISENEDGSITYGAIDENKHLIQSNWLPIPKGIIPINDGKVTIGYDGTIKIEGTVITAKGYRITANIFKIYELFNDYDNLIENDDYVDKSAVYNPKCYIDTDEGFKFVTLHIADINKPKDVYQYHPDNESYYVMNTEVGIVATYKRMPGWDVFVKDSPDNYNLSAAGLWYQPISATTGEDIKFDKTHYPWVAKGRIMIGNKLRLPHVRFNPDCIIDCYSTFDHTAFWYPKDLTNAAVYNVDEDHIYLTTPHREEDILVPIKIGKVTSKFFPYNGGKVVFTKEDGKTFVTVTGNVIWNRNDQYYTLDEGKSELNVEWPDIKEDENGHYVSLFTVNGYFKDEPIFISKDGKHGETVGNDLITIDGVKRQEEGMFRLIKRNVTAYLTDYEKYFIDNHVPNYRTFNYNEKTGKIDEVQYYANQITSDDTGLLLDYYQFRFNEVLPLAVSCNAIYLDDRYGDIKDTKRLYWYDRDKQSLLLYRDMYFSLYNRELNRTRLLKVKKDQSNLTYGDITTFKGHMDQVGMQPALGYSLKEGNNANVRNTVERSESMFGNKPHITVPKAHIISDGYLQVTVSGVTVPTNLFWRFGNDTKTISEGTSVKTDESFELDVSSASILKFNYIELWLDDPFNEDSELHRVILRRDRTLSPLEIIRPEVVDDFTTEISVMGESKTHIVLVDPLNPDVILAEGDSDDNGIIAFKDITLLANHKYKLIQTDNWGLTSELVFEVKKHAWKNDDFITPKQLFGKDINSYYYPYNVRHKDNLNEVLNLIDSRLVIDANVQKYTIAGIMMDDEGNIFPEGTYDIGTHPESYKAIYITGDLIRSKVAQKIKRGAAGYVVGEMFSGGLNKSLKVSKASFTKNELTTEKYAIPLQWLTDGQNYLNNLEFWDGEHLHFTKLDAKDLLTNLKTKLHFGNIGRYQNRLVIEDIAVFKLGLNDNLFDILGYEESEGIYNRYNKEGYSFEQLLKSLKVKVDYWYDHVSDLKGKPFVQNHLSLDHSSYTIPKDRQIRSFAVSTLEAGYKHNNQTVITPTSYTTDYIFNIYTLKNHNNIVKYNDYHNEQNIVHYGVSYAYQLKRNYTDSTPMDDLVFDYWSKKGFNPNLFHFDDKTLGWVEYDKLGEGVTLHGRVKIAGKYTKNKTQKVTDKSQIEFINHCPDGFIVHDSTGSVTLNDDDSLDFNGIVYGRECVNGEYVDIPYVKVTTPKHPTLISIDVSEADYGWGSVIEKFKGKIVLGNISDVDTLNNYQLFLNLLGGFKTIVLNDDNYVKTFNSDDNTLTITGTFNIPYGANLSIGKYVLGKVNKFTVEHVSGFVQLTGEELYGYFVLKDRNNGKEIGDHLYFNVKYSGISKMTISNFEYLPDESPLDHGYMYDPKSYKATFKNVDENHYANLEHLYMVFVVTNNINGNGTAVDLLKSYDKVEYDADARTLALYYYNVDTFKHVNNVNELIVHVRDNKPMYPALFGPNEGVNFLTEGTAFINTKIYFRFRKNVDKVDYDKYHLHSQPILSGLNYKTDLYQLSIAGGERNNDGLRVDFKINKSTSTMTDYLKRARVIEYKNAGYWEMQNINTVWDSTLNEYTTTFNIVIPSSNGRAFLSPVLPTDDFVSYGKQKTEVINFYINRNMNGYPFNPISYNVEKVSKVLPVGLTITNRVSEYSSNDVNDVSWVSKHIANGYGSISGKITNIPNEDWYKIKVVCEIYFDDDKQYTYRVIGGVSKSYNYNVTSDNKLNDLYFNRNFELVTYMDKGFILNYKNDKYIRLTGSSDDKFVNCTFYDGSDLSSVKRIKHVYRVIHDDAPDFKSDTVIFINDVIPNTEPYYNLSNNLFEVKGLLSEKASYNFKNKNAWVDINCGTNDAFRYKYTTYQIVVEWARESGSGVITSNEVDLYRENNYAYKGIVNDKNVSKYVPYNDWYSIPLRSFFNTDDEYQAVYDYLNAVHQYNKNIGNTLDTDYPAYEVTIPDLKYLKISSIVRYKGNIVETFKIYDIHFKPLARVAEFIPTLNKDNYGWLQDDTDITVKYINVSEEQSKHPQFGVNMQLRQWLDSSKTKYKLLGYAGFNQNSGRNWSVAESNYDADTKVLVRKYITRNSRLADWNSNYPSVYTDLIAEHKYDYQIDDKIFSDSDDKSSYKELYHEIITTSFNGDRGFYTGVVEYRNIRVHRPWIELSKNNSHLVITIHNAPKNLKHLGYISSLDSTFKSLESFTPTKADVLWKAVCAIPLSAFKSGTQKITLTHDGFFSKNKQFWLSHNGLSEDITI